MYRNASPSSLRHGQLREVWRRLFINIRRFARRLQIRCDRLRARAPWNRLSDLPYAVAQSESSLHQSAQRERAARLKRTLPPTRGPVPQELAEAQFYYLRFLLRRVGVRAFPPDAKKLLSTHLAPEVARHFCTDLGIDYQEAAKSAPLGTSAAVQSSYKWCQQASDTGPVDPSAMLFSIELGCPAMVQRYEQKLRAAQSIVFLSERLGSCILRLLNWDHVQPLICRSWGEIYQCDLELWHAWLINLATLQSEIDRRVAAADLKPTPGSACYLWTSGHTSKSDWPRAWPTIAFVRDLAIELGGDWNSVLHMAAYQLRTKPPLRRMNLM